MDVFVDLQDLAYIAPDPEKYPGVTPPTEDDIVGVVGDVAGCGVTGVSEEMFLAGWFEPTHKACQEKGLTYIHKAINWDLGAMATNWKTTVFETYSHCDILMTEDYDMTLDPPLMPGYIQFPGISEYLGKEYHVKVYAGAEGEACI
jgi:hypothetical protein